jgi:hypothetical protein
MSQYQEHYPEGNAFYSGLRKRYLKATIWQALFFSALLIAIISLTALLYNVVDGAFGYVAYDFKNAPTEFTSTPISELSKEELLIILKDNLSSGAYKENGNTFPVRSICPIFGTPCPDRYQSNMEHDRLLVSQG